MAEPPNDPHNTDSTFIPAPPEAPKLYQVTILFIYHIVLALLLAYTIYNVWPENPWPGDRPINANTQNAKNSNNANANEGVPNLRPGAGSNNSSATGNNPNTNNPPTGNGGTTSNSAGNSNNGPGGGGAGAGTRNGAGANATPTPTPDKSQVEDNEDRPPSFKVFGQTFRPRLEVRLLLLVMLVGAIGSYVHATSSFVDYLGNRTLISSWVWWYLLRPFIGMMLALVFYFVFRGGFVTAGVGGPSDDATRDPARFINPFGIAAMAALVGMFSKVASDKLNEVFTTLFRPAPGQGDAKRGDKLGSSLVPAVTSISPASVKKGDKNVSITIKGANFTDKSAVTFNNKPRTAKFVDATELNLPLQEADTATAGTFEITVTNPPPGGGAAKPVQFKVEE